MKIYIRVKITPSKYNWIGNEDSRVDKYKTVCV